MDTLMNVTVGQIIAMVTGAIAVVTLFVEFNQKIRKFPISAILNWIGKRTNAELFEQLEKLEAKVDDVSKRQTKAENLADERNAVERRVRIIAFSDELRQGINHSQEGFDQVLQDIDEYESYCNAHPGFKNKKAGTAEKRIEHAYNECMDKNNFL